jgi:hypothetical protein
LSNTKREENQRQQNKAIQFTMASNQSKPRLDANTTEDPFDSLLTLEDTLYTSAYSLGASDGAHAGRIEGRIFGLEKGFEKFAELGQLHGRSVVWGARALTPSNTTATSKVKVAKENEDTKKTVLPAFPQNPRLTNNITLLNSLTDPLTFSTDNTEEAVADFDDRVKRAGAKAKVVERIVGEAGPAAGSTKSPDGSPARGKARNVKLNEGKGKKGDDSIEDFAGSRLLR